MKDVMLDLETLGTNPESPILAIGAVEFDVRNKLIGRRFFVALDVEEQYGLGAKADPSTIEWWERQSAKAKEQFANKVDFEEGMTMFSDWFQQCDPSPRIWGNGPSFDCVILGRGFVRLKRAIPWKYNNERCFRTVSGLKPSLEIVRVGTYHNAVDDAETQARHVIKIFGG